jgi:uncharacterized protein DUF3352
MQKTTRPILSATARGWAIIAVIALMLGMIPVGATAQDTPATSSLDPIWNLVPGEATAAIAINADPASPQWQTAAELLDSAGLEDVVYGAINEFIDQTDLAAANFVPGQSSILGGTIAAATWGSMTDTFARGAVYVSAPDPDRAYRSLAAQLITESNPDAVEVELPGGRATLDANGYGTAAVMQLNDIVVVTESADAQKIAALATGGGPTLADFEPFTTVMAAQSGDLIARAYANGPASSQLLGASLSQPFGLGFSEFGILFALAAPISGTHASFGLSASEDGFLLHTARLPAPLIGPELPGTGPSADLASEVSSLSDVFLAGTDLGRSPIFTQLIDTIVIGVASSAGWSPYEPTLDIRAWAYEQLKRMTNIDVQADLMDQLQGDYLIAGKVDTFDDPTGVHLAVTSEVADAETVNNALAKLSAVLSLATAGRSDVTYENDPTQRSGLTNILTVRDGDTGRAALTIKYGLSGPGFVLTVNAGEELLNPTPGDDLATDPDYRAAIAKLPVQDGSPIYLNLQNLITVANLTSLEPPDTWGIDNPQHAPLDGIRSLVGMTYEQDGLAMTDLLLEIAAAPPVQTEATPESTDSFIPDLVIRDATAIDVGKRRVLSIAPDGSRAVVRGDGDELCVVPLDGSGDEHCTDQIRGVAAEHLVWSQDSAMVALSENAPRNLVDSDIWTINAETGDVRNLTDDDYEGELVLSDGQPGIPDSIPVDGGPVFTPDGAEIIFSRTDWSEGGFDTDLYQIDVEGGQPQHIAFFSSEPFVAWHGAIWQDDTTLLLSYGSVSARQPNNGFWSVDIGSGDMRQIWHGTEDQYNAMPVMFLPDGQLVVHDQAVYSIFMDSCPYIVLDLASGEQQPIREGNDYCASVVGISPSGAMAIASAVPDYGFWFVDLTTFATSEVNADSFATAIPPDRRATRIAGAEDQPIVWTDDNDLIVVVNYIFPIRVQLEFAA